MAKSDRLVELAGKDKNRLAVLEGRNARMKSRSRRLICAACNESDYDNRDVSDICDQCLIDLWGARNIIKGEYKAGQKSGLLPFKLTRMPHWLEYPHLSTTQEEIPEDAPFARGDKSSDRAIQEMYVEIIKGLSEAMPCDPASREDAKSLIEGGSSFSDQDTIYVRLPAITAKALRDLWDLIRWHSHEAHRQGFETGRDLLSQMNLGKIGYEGFIQEIADQTERSQAELKRIADEATGKRRRNKGS